MGEYAEYALEYAARNMRDPVRRDPNQKRNEKSARCPICGKGIRHINGEVRESLAMHMKSKHPADQ